MESAHFRFVHLADEKHVGHVSDRGDGCTFAEGSDLLYGIADLDRYLENGAVDTRAHNGVSGLSCGGSDTLFHNGEVVLRNPKFLLRLEILQFGLVVILACYNALDVQCRVTHEHVAYIAQVDLGEAYTRLGAAERLHVGHHPDLGDGFAFLYGLSRLFVDFGHEALNLGFDSHLVARLDLASDDGAFFKVTALHTLHLILHGFGLLAFPKEKEGCNHACDEQDNNNPSECFFHIVCLFYVILR